MVTLNHYRGCLSPQIPTVSTVRCGCLETLPFVQILRANPNEAATLTEVAFASKRHWGYPERWIESWRDMLTVTPGFIATHETYAAVVDGRAVGFYALGRKGDRLELLHMWVLPAATGCGVGRALFLHALERMQALGFQELEIESDSNAEGFYRRLGAHRRDQDP
jgi:GNAT superfamily N-acetyltransferase